jgi:alpha-glucosidase
VPLPWSGDRSPFGFSPGPADPWLPQPAHWAELTVEAQQRDPASMLHLYRTALRLRSEVHDLRDPGLHWLPAPDGVLHFRRGDRFECLANLGDAAVPLPEGVVLSSRDGDGQVVEPDTTVWVVQP